MKPINYAPCMDCGTDTAPCTDKRMCHGRRGCRHNAGKRWEWYMVWPAVWSLACGHDDAPGYLCIGCLERRLGRPLTRGDFTLAPVNQPGRWDSPRLAAARQRVPAGERLDR